MLFLIMYFNHGIYSELSLGFWFMTMVCIVTLLRIIFTIRQKNNEKPPLAPKASPFIGHLRMFLSDPKQLASVISDWSNPNTVFRFKLPFDELWLARGSSQIAPILLNPKTFDFEPMKSMVLRRILGLSDTALKAVDRDDSGVSTKPLLNTNVPDHARFNYFERKATQDFSRPSPHAAFVGQFEKNLYQWAKHCDITTDWSCFPDLYVFVRDILFRMTCDAFYGPHLLRQSPHLAEDIWKFDEEIPYLARGFPSIFNPSAKRVRTNCVQALRKWRNFAIKGRSTTSLSEWNETSGLKCMSLRNEVFERFEGWDETSQAASDLAVLFGLNSNAVRATFWFLFETLRSKDLCNGASEEVRSLITSHELPYRFDTKKLLQSPLLQSIYAETLRTYVSVMMLRKTRQESKIGKWKVPQNKKIVVCNYSEHMNQNLWQSSSAKGAHPVDKFWGRRFITVAGMPDSSTEDPNPQDSATFSTENMGCKWFPFGFGERICPGRHFAKHQMLLTFAVISTTFDIELMIPHDSDPKPDMKYFGYGVMPPNADTPFRIRKRMPLATKRARV